MVRDQCCYFYVCVSNVARTTICEIAQNEHAKEQNWFVTKCVNSNVSEIVVRATQKGHFYWVWYSGIAILVQ